MDPTKFQRRSDLWHTNQCYKKRRAFTRCFTYHCLNNTRSTRGLLRQNKSSWHLLPMKGQSFQSRKLFQTIVRSNKEPSLLKKAQCNGSIFQPIRQHGSQQTSYGRCFQIWTLRTSIRMIEEVLIGYDNLRGVIS